MGAQDNTTAVEGGAVELEVAEILRKLSRTEEPFALRFSVVQTLKENTDLLMKRPRLVGESKSAYVILWSIVLDMASDEAEEIRELCSQINTKLTGDQLSEELTQCALTRGCLREVGVVWPAAATLL